MTDYTTVKAHVRDVAHRPDITAAQFNRWDTIVTSRINDRLKENELILVSTTTMATNPDDVNSPSVIPAGDVLEVRITTSGGKQRKLRNASRETVINWLNESGDPVYYNMEGDKIRIAPYTANTNLTITYRFKAFTLQSGSSNAVLTEKPQLYYNGFLWLAFEWAKDFEAAKYYQEQFIAEIDALNSHELGIYAGESPEMNGATTWVT